MRLSIAGRKWNHEQLARIFGTPRLAGPAIPPIAPALSSGFPMADSTASRSPPPKVRARWPPCWTKPQERKVPVHRVSQGSGIMLMTDAEISEMLELGRKAGIEVNLFIGPRATFDIGAQAYHRRRQIARPQPARRRSTGLRHGGRQARRPPGPAQRAGFRHRHPANRGQHARRRRPSRRISSSRLR